MANQLNLVTCSSWLGVCLLAQRTGYLGHRVLRPGDHAFVGQVLGRPGTRGLLQVVLPLLRYSSPHFLDVDKIH